MPKQYRVAIVGTGRVGALWETDPPTGISHAGAFALLPECSLVAGVNRGRTRLEEFGRRFGVTALYTDYQQMLAEVRPDILCVATHPGSHAAIVEAAVASGVRAIFCEKPLALDMADTDRIINACDAAGVLLSVNHSRRWYPAYRRARELLLDGAIGDLVAMTGYCQGGKPAPSWQSELEGPLLHDATHLFDMLRYFAGDARWVAATAQRRRHTQYPVEDDSSAMIGFDHGVTAITQVNELSAYTRFEVELHGTNGAMRLGNDGYWIGRPTPIVIEQPPAEHPEFEWQRLEWHPLEFEHGPPAFLQAARELLDALEGKTSLCSSGADGRASMEIIEAIYASQVRGNGPVTLPLASDSRALADLVQAEGWD